MPRWNLAMGNDGSGTLTAIMPNGAVDVTAIVPPAGATVNGTTLLLPAGGGGGGGGGGGAQQYAVFIVTPAPDSRQDVAPWQMVVRVAPAPPVGTIVRVYRNGVLVASGQVLSGDTATVNIPTQAVGAYNWTASIAPEGTTFTSDAVPIAIYSQSPIVDITSPSPDADLGVGVVAVLIRVRHDSATHDQLRVQASSSQAWTSIANAVWQSGEPTDPGGAIYAVNLTLSAKANYWLQARAFDATPGGSASLSPPIHVCTLDNWLEFTTEGASFNPQIELSEGATVTWTPSEGAPSNALEPNWNWGSVAQRTVRLVVTPWRALHLINFGFNHADDTGREALSPAYNRPNQYVSSIGNPGRATSLWALLAAHNPFAGTLDLSGFSNLVWLECFQSSLSSLILTGCTSLRRLCVEQCALSTLDIRDQRDCLYDLRAAAQQSGALEITMARMSIEYHFCTRSQVLRVRNEAGTLVSGAEFYALLPAIEELWDFGCSRTGSCEPRSPYLRSVQCFVNLFSSIDLTDQIPLGRGGELIAYNQALTSVVLTRCRGLLLIDLRNCGLTTAAVDAILLEVESWMTNNAELLLAGNAGPSPAGEARAVQLESRFWTVTRAPVVYSGVNVDEFDRPAGDVGNGWTQMLGTVAGQINGTEQLVLNANAYAVFGNAGSSLPVNYRVETSFPDATLAVGFFGLVGRFANGNGVRLLFWSRNDAHIGDASGWNDAPAAITVTNGYPASWALNQTHTLALSCVGTRCAIICDGQEYGYATVATNAGLSGTAYGICGESNNRVFNRMAAVGL